MKERPILFSPQMVRALIEGGKTQTRRTIKNAFDGETWAGNVYPARESGWIAWWPGGTAEFTKQAYANGFECPYGQPGDKLWVRETFCCVHGTADGPRDDDFVRYRADGGIGEKVIDSVRGWKPSIFMPKAYSRITLTIADVRVQRLQEISHRDALAEGVEYDVSKEDRAPLQSFQTLWESINGAGSWNANPWVWCISFTRSE